ncbi:hypothetical protein Bca52824_070031 [Brassica carinata]|uniref:Uncharacterized protein n=1 Tax=Brassica carinata TaxID=52824 RepID=A0A8X7U1W8_BRACI|nr:hypothetical protein Bca52824_070031 [Brassica carinata]
MSRLKTKRFGLWIWEKILYAYLSKSVVLETLRERERRRLATKTSEMRWVRMRKPWMILRSEKEEQVWSKASFGCFERSVLSTLLLIL